MADPSEAVRITRDLYGEHTVLLRDDEDEDLYLRAEDVLERVSRERGNVN